MYIKTKDNRIDIVHAFEECEIPNFYRRYMIDRGVDIGGKTHEEYVISETSIYSPEDIEILKDEEFVLLFKAA